VRTPLLLDVPKDSPTRKQRLEQIKSLLMIQTHYCDGLPDAPWMAMHMPAARSIGKPYGVKPTDDMFECMWHVYRLLDEAGVVQEGKTERDAIRKLCDHLGLPLNL